MLLGLVVTSLFAGADAPSALLNGMPHALDQEVLFAAMAFVLMVAPHVVDRTGLIQKLLAVPNPDVRPVPRWACVVDTAGSAVMGRCPIELATPPPPAPSPGP
ncbi:hypothetical protein HBB16_12825 [Pseudonocardia sp. MCCB 268]|nr:hypothetical protein [Pseudonocardia cytotoxica]